MGLVDVAFFVTLAVVTWRAISAFKAWMTCRRLRVEASRGHARAQSVLGSMYATGRGVPQDDGEAARWYRLAAEQGHYGAQVELGTMYASGKGVPRDRVTAYLWLTLAAPRLRGRERMQAIDLCSGVEGGLTETQLAACLGIGGQVKA